LFVTPALFVIPAKAGTQPSMRNFSKVCRLPWFPTFVGMTKIGVVYDAAPITQQEFAATPRQ
jgi:hypothetical protein